MKRTIFLALPLLCLVVLIHDSATGRFSVFRKTYNQDDLNRQLFGSFGWNVDFSPDPERAIALLSKGADVHARDHFGATPLHQASWCGETEVVRLMLARGADVHARDQWGATPLHYCDAHLAEPAVAEALIGEGADVNATDLSGRTPLHRVARSAWLDEVVRVLLAHGAEVNAKDDEGKTPLDMAATGRSRNAVTDLLCRHGGTWGGFPARMTVPRLVESIVRQVERQELLVGLVLDESPALLDRRKEQIRDLYAHLARKSSSRRMAWLRLAAISFSRKPKVWLQPTRDFRLFMKAIDAVKSNASETKDVEAALDLALKTYTVHQKPVFIVFITDDTGLRDLAALKKDSLLWRMHAAAARVIALEPDEGIEKPPRAPD